jgi:hypothetical protein
MTWSGRPGSERTNWQADDGGPQEVNAMGVLVSKKAADTATERSMRVAMILSLALLGIAGAYFGSLYLIAH